MKCKIAFGLLGSLLLPAGQAQPPRPGTDAGMVQVSSAQAEPANLSCGAGAKESTVTVQVWFIGLAKTLVDPEITIGLYQSWGLPVGNQLQISPQRQQVKLERSPATVQYKVECGHETVPGDAAFTAFIEAAPAGVKINPADPPETGQVKIHIESTPPK